MARQSVTLTEPNDAWLQEQVAGSEFASKSEAINDLIRKARAEEAERNFIRAQLIASEERTKREGYVEQSAEDILTKFKAKARRDGKL
ncbi:MAG: CopG family transcriptional regulator [Pseudomonadota bacterium]